MNSFILVLAALFSVAYAADWNITGASRAEDGQFSHQISLRVYGSHVCSGSIINDQWVLTAAHCVIGISPSSMTVVAGTNKLNDQWPMRAGGGTYKVEHVIPHNSFSVLRLHNDIALLKISGSIIFGDKVQPIPLETGDIRRASDVVLSGWGRLSYPGNVPNNLQYLPLKALATEDCIQRHSGTGIPTDATQLCTLTARAEGVCHGDPGAPLVYQGKLAGIVAAGHPCGIPDVFTLVSSYIGWINENMQ